MKLIFLHGLPGVGKLTVANELAKLTGFKVFHNHLVVDLVESVFEFGTPPFVYLRETIWLVVFERGAQARLPSLIFTFAFDRSVSSNFISNVQALMKKNDIEICFVELTCSRPELEKRLVVKSRRHYGKISSLEQFNRLREEGAFVDPGIPPDKLTLDTTTLPPSEAATLIVAILKL